MNFGDLECVILEPQDWAIYKELCPHYAGIEAAAFFEACLSDPSDRHLVLMRAGEAVGIASVLTASNGSFIYLDQLYVKPAYRNLGYAGYLHEARLHIAAEISAFQYACVDVAKDNGPAISALETAGFKRVPENKQPPAKDFIRYRFDLTQLREPPSQQVGLQSGPC